MRKIETVTKRLYFSRKYKCKTRNKKEKYYQISSKIFKTIYRSLVMDREKVTLKNLYNIIYMYNI